MKIRLLEIARLLEPRRAQPAAVAPIDRRPNVAHLAGKSGRIAQHLRSGRAEGGDGDRARRWFVRQRRQCRHSAGECHVIARAHRQ